MKAVLSRRDFLKSGMAAATLPLVAGVASASPADGLRHRLMLFSEGAGEALNAPEMLRRFAAAKDGSPWKGRIVVVGEGYLPLDAPPRTALVAPSALHTLPPERLALLLRSGGSVALTAAGPPARIAVHREARVGKLLAVLPFVEVPRLWMISGRVPGQEEGRDTSARPVTLEWEA